MDPNSPTSVNSALRYWGCTIQAGAPVSGAFGIGSPHLSAESMEEVKNNFSPLPFYFHSAFLNELSNRLEFNHAKHDKIL